MNSLRSHHTDLQELHWTKELKVERIRTTRLGYRPELQAALDHTFMHSPGRYSEESSLNNISVKTCEKHSNSAQNSVKATDIRTNATDVETRINIVH